MCIHARPLIAGDGASGAHAVTDSFASCSIVHATILRLKANVKGD